MNAKLREYVVLATADGSQFESVHSVCRGGKTTPGLIAVNHEQDKWRIMSSLNGKVAIVTGASKGIGSGIATALAAGGARVAVNYSSDRKGAERVVQAIIDSGGKAIAVGADVSKAPDVTRLFKEVDAAFGRLDVLVNNAGVFRFGTFGEITEESFHLHYNINVLGPILTTQEAIKRFGAEGGSIINLSSIVGSNPVPGAVLYASTKGAIEALTKGLALELAPRKIRVNAIAPGHTETEGNITAGTFEGGAAAELAAKTPLGRIGRVTDIAPLAVFLASDESAWITGEVIRAAGGLVVAT
jgi:3-oxoacyl-[acyl-carrier protein] reductase